MHLYRLFDCAVAIDLDLHLPEAEPTLVPELTVRRGASPMDLGWEPKPDDLLTDFSDDATGVRYVAARTPEGFRLRFGGLCEFDLSADLTSATWALHPERDARLVPVLAAGALMAFRFVIAGQLVLHASAVHARGRGLAFVGDSGMGKSTMATLMCAGGASLLTDDLARISFADARARLSPGGGESRLRPTSAGLANLFDTARVTADGRTAVALPRWTAGPVALDAVVIPLPSREHASVELTALAPPSALILLGQFPRLPGWIDAELVRQQFELLADLVDQVPAYLAVVPWGPPFTVETGERLLDALGWPS
jgi:hypothetical protein